MAKAKKRRANSGQCVPASINNADWLAQPVNQAQLNQMAREQHVQDAFNAIQSMRLTLDVIGGKLDRLRYQ